MVATVSASSLPNSFSGFPAISTYKLADKNPQFHFAAPPKFVLKVEMLSSDAKILYGFYRAKGAKTG